VAVAHHAVARGVLECCYHATLLLISNEYVRDPAYVVAHTLTDCSRQVSLHLMRLSTVPFSLTMSLSEGRALRRMRSALRLASETDTLRAILHAAHAELCPDPEVDADLALVAAERAARAARAPKKRTPRKKPKPVVRACAWRKCGQEFTVPWDNKAQKYCCRACSHLGRRKH
jgi:hypothetical protein